MTCKNCYCPECVREKVNARLRLWVAQREHNKRDEAAHQWDAGEEHRQPAKVEAE